MLLAFVTPVSVADNYEKTDSFQVQQELLSRQYGLLSQKLYVSIPPSLYDYYSNVSHIIHGDSEYSKFVTPQAIKPIAESIRKVSSGLPYSDEQFADAVLSLVHQIPYRVSGAKYPVETLVANSGDCVGLSLLAASIMKAGGLDVVLIHYIGIDPGHLNVGVYLPYTPVYHTFLMTPASFEYNNKTYWTAEATPKGNWKVGDQPELVTYAEPLIIPLDNPEKSSPAQVSSSLASPLLSSSITVNVSEGKASAQENRRSVAISGSISPVYSGENVSVYISNNGTFPDYFTTVTDGAGGYMLTWNLTSAGTYFIRTSWSGTSTCTGADSEILTVFVGPESLVRFNNLGYDYIFGQSSFFGGYLLRALKGVDSFLSTPLGTNVSITYDFTVLKVGHTVSNSNSKTITIPASKQIRVIGPRQSKIMVRIEIPERTITAPIDVPSGLEPIRLPDDFDQTISNQFCFILQNNGSDSYSLDIRALDEYSMSSMIEGNGSTTFLMNASESVKENGWYRIKESFLEKGITANLLNANGTLMQSMVTPHNSMNSNETAILITNNVDNVVVFKSLKIQTSNNTTQPSKSNRETTNDNGLLVPYVYSSVLLVATFAAAVYFKKKKQTMRKP